MNMCMLDALDSHLKLSISRISCNPDKDKVFKESECMAVRDTVNLIHCPCVFSYNLVK